MVVSLAGVTAIPVWGQFETQLDPLAKSDYENYVKGVEKELGARWTGAAPILMVDENSAEKTRAHKGELVITQVHNSKSTVRNGMVHDWVGTTFIPGATVERVVSVLADFDHHKDIYPDVVQSNLVSRQGDMETGRWRLKRSKVITVELEVNQQAEYIKVSSAIWKIRSHSTQIREVQSPGPNEKLLPPGEGNGFMWNLDAFWTLRQEEDGVYAECRTTSLSRQIPGTLVWLVKPMIESLPKESLASTLRCTREAVHNPKVPSMPAPGAE
jgi:hypothetical protein